jgi:hypothetical protein
MTNNSVIATANEMSRKQSRKMHRFTLIGYLIITLMLAACEAPTQDEPPLQDSYPDLNDVPERPDIPENQETSKERLEKDLKKAETLHKSIYEIK